MCTSLDLTAELRADLPVPLCVCTVPVRVVLDVVFGTESVFGECMSRCSRYGSSVGFESVDGGDSTWGLAG